jgi:bifunctional DNase/RNase
MNVPMQLSRVLILDSSPEQFITLEEVGGTRSFAIKIGTMEAVAIDRRLRGEAPPRPQTHELLDSAIRALGGELEKVLIHTLDKGTFFATLLIRQQGELVEVDARPSDALALAVSRRTPIEVDEEVVREASDERPDILPPIEAGEEDDDD